MKLGLVGEAANPISMAMLRAALDAPGVEVAWFADAVISPRLRTRLYGPSFDEGPWMRAIQRFRGLRGGRGPDCPGVCAAEGIPYLRPEGFSLERGLPARCYEHPEAEFVLLAGCDQLLKENALRLARRRVINYHYSPLPAYRGKFALFWQWYNREPRLGFSFHEVDLGVDTGGTIHQEYVDYDPDAPLAAAADRVIRASATGLPRMLELAAQGGSLLIEPTPPESYYPSSRYRDLVTVTPDRSLDEVLAVFGRTGFLLLPNGFRIRHVADSGRETAESLRVEGRGIVVPLRDGWILASPTARLPFRLYRGLVGAGRLVTGPPGL